MKNYHLLYTLLLACAAAAHASVADEAASLMQAGDYAAAREILEAELAASPAARELGRLNALLGECLIEEGLPELALPRLELADKKGIADARLWLGRLAFQDYDFDKAARYYASYRTARKKNPAEELESYSAQLDLGRSMLDNVESIVVLDSITADAASFFSAYRIPPSAGRLSDSSAIPFEESRDLASMAFSNEGADFMMWAEPDSTGTLRLMECTRLTDGSWTTPSFTPDMLNMGGDADFPFMLSDGATLYYASDGEGSLGGYDIFIASRDAASGEYLQPRNPGMPFNSPFDDYMMVIDEQNGLGWWATDRNRIPGKVTIYVYELPEARSNIDPDDEDLTALARLSDYRITWPDTEEGIQHAEEMRASIAHIDTRPPRRKDFSLPMPGGRIYTEWSDFSSKKAADLMRQYLKEKQKADKEKARLASLRRKYSSSRRDNDLMREISDLECRVENSRESLRSALSEIYRVELLR